MNYTDELKAAIDSIADRTPTPPNAEMMRLRDMLDVWHRHGELGEYDTWTNEWVVSE